jgi:hypothetical protein
MTTTRSTQSRPTAQSGAILADAARRMLPVLAGRVLTAVTDRAVAKVDGLADRLDERRTGGRPDRGETGAPDGDQGPGRAGVAVAFLLEQARLFLAFVARLAAQALEMLRRATERLRARRAPEGIDEAPDPEEVTAPEDLDEDELDDLDELDEDELEEERVTTGV